MRDYQIERREATPVRLLAVRRRARLSELSKVVPEACGAVWGVVSQQTLAAPGRNVAVYFNDEIDLEVGVEVGPDATEHGEVVLSSTPSGPVAMTTHLGSYADLHNAHVAVRKWCAANQYSLAGPNWEVYGHWSDDPAKLTTDIFYLLIA